MGYSESLARRAVQLFPNSNEQALEHCLMHQDEDELELAIQLSLQANETTENDAAAEEAAEAEAQAAAAAEAEQKEKEEKARKEEEERKLREEKLRKEVQHQKMVKLEQMIVEPIKKAEITKFTNEMVPGCLQLLDDDPDTVYRISDLLIVTIRRNGSKWQDLMLKQIVVNITTIAAEVAKECNSSYPVMRKNMKKWHGFQVH